MNIFQKLFDWTFLGNTLQCFGIFPFIWNILGKKFLNVLEQFQKCKTFSTEHFRLFGTFWVNSSWMFWNNFKSAKLFLRNILCKSYSTKQSKMFPNTLWMFRNILKVQIFYSEYFSKIIQNILNCSWTNLELKKTIWNVWQKIFLRTFWIKSSTRHSGNISKQIMNVQEHFK